MSITAYLAKLSIDAPEVRARQIHQLPKVRKIRRPGIVHKWCIEALEALGAYDDFANAVAHGQVWDKIREMNQHLLQDPVAKVQLEAEEPFACKILLHEEARMGGVGRHLNDLSQKWCMICQLRGDDERNTTIHPHFGKPTNLYFLKRTSVTNASS